MPASFPRTAYLFGDILPVLLFELVHFALERLGTCGQASVVFCEPLDLLLGRGAVLHDSALWISEEGNPSEASTFDVEAWRSRATWRSF